MAIFFSASTSIFPKNLIFFKLTMNLSTFLIFSTKYFCHLPQLPEYCHMEMLVIAVEQGENVLGHDDDDMIYTVSATGGSGVF